MRRCVWRLQWIPPLFFSRVGHLTLCATRLSMNRFVFLHYSISSLSLLPFAPNKISAPRRRFVCVSRRKLRPLGLCFHDLHTHDRGDLVVVFEGPFRSLVVVIGIKPQVIFWRQVEDNLLIFNVLLVVLMVIMRKWVVYLMTTTCCGVN